MPSSLIMSYLAKGAGVNKSVLSSDFRLCIESPETTETCTVTAILLLMMIVERNTDYLLRNGYVKITYVSCHAYVFKKF